jgi:hypothetical protein
VFFFFSRIHLTNFFVSFASPFTSFCRIFYPLYVSLSLSLSLSHTHTHSCFLSPSHCLLFCLFSFMLLFICLSTRQYVHQFVSPSVICLSFPLSVRLGPLLQNLEKLKPITDQHKGKIRLKHNYEKEKDTKYKSL